MPARCERQPGEQCCYAPGKTLRPHSHHGLTAAPQALPPAPWLCQLEGARQALAPVPPQLGMLGPGCSQVPQQLWGEAKPGQREEQSPPASWEPPGCQNPPCTTTAAPSWQSSLRHRTRQGHAVQLPLTPALQQLQCPASEARRGLQWTPTRSPNGGDRRALCGRSATRGGPGPPAAPLEGVRSAQEREVQALVSALSPFEVTVPGTPMAAHQQGPGHPSLQGAEPPAQPIQLYIPPVPARNLGSICCF